MTLHLLDFFGGSLVYSIYFRVFLGTYGTFWIPFIMGRFVVVARVRCLIAMLIAMLIPSPGPRDGSMGLWEVSEEVLSQAERKQSEEGVPCYSHISHRALEDIPKEYTNPYNCKVRALAFNNNHKVR